MKRKRMRKRRCGALLLTFSIAASPVLLPGIGGQAESYAASLSDISDHWARSYIERAVDYGFVNGYTDGTFKPDASITRAEFTKMFNSALENEASASIDFADVKQDDWFYDDICKGVAASFITGYSDTEFAPSKNITRQETAVMLSRIVPAAGEDATLKVFGDYEDVDFWAEKAFSKIVAKGYIGGYNDGDLHPRDNLTRAQAAKLMVDIFENENIVSKNQTVVLSGVTLEDTIYTNRISVGEKVGDGDTLIDNCVILGTLNIEGGGNGDGGSGVRIRDSRVSSAEIHRNSGNVLVQAEGETTVVRSEASDEAFLREKNLDSSGDFGQGFVSVSAGRAAYTSLAGDFDRVEISAPKVDLMIEEGTVNQLTADSYATKTNILLSSAATINTADIRAEELVLEGEGRIRQLNAGANGITYETAPDNVTVAFGVTEPPKQVIIERATPLLKSLAIRFFDSDGEASYTNLPVSSSVFNYYIPSASTDLTLNFRAVDDETANGYVADPKYTVRYGGATQEVTLENGLAVCRISVGAGSTTETITVTLGSESRGYSSKTYTINLRRISPEISSVFTGGRDITGYVSGSQSAAAANPYETGSSSAGITVNLREVQNPDFVSYSVYRLTPSGAELVADDISGGNSVSLQTGYIYRITTECRCYSDSYAGCRVITGTNGYLSLQ